MCILTTFGVSRELRDSLRYQAMLRGTGWEARCYSVSEYKKEQSPRKEGVSGRAT